MKRLLSVFPIQSATRSRSNFRAQFCPTSSVHVRPITGRSNFFEVSTRFFRTYTRRRQVKLTSRMNLFPHDRFGQYGRNPTYQSSTTITETNRVTINTGRLNPFISRLNHLSSRFVVVTYHFTSSCMFQVSVVRKSASFVGNVGRTINPSSMDQTT